MKKHLLWFLPFIMTTAHAQSLKTGFISPVSHEHNQAAQPYVRPTGTKSLKITKAKPALKSNCQIAFIKISPNPSASNTTLQLTAKERGKISFAMYDLLGKKIMEQKNLDQSAGLQTHYLKTEALTAGTYLLEAGFESSGTKQTCTISQKFIKN